MLGSILGVKHNSEGPCQSNRAIVEEEPMLDFQVGDKVIHASYGLGEIVKMDEQFIHNRQMLCYVVRIRDLTLWVKADETGKSGLRRPTLASDFEKLFAILRSPGELLPPERFDRKLELDERMKSGALASICSVIRDLALYKREKKKFNENDKSVMDRAKSFLFTEWMYSRSASFAQVNDELIQMME
jgi:RNA polymerase-interacting CarD/CdnL/TRCF family regulator